MTRRQAVVCVAAMSIWASTATAQEPDWAGMGYTTHQTFQAVDANGSGTFPTFMPIRMKGIILNRPSDMLDPAVDSTPYMGGQWQVFVQAVDERDFGGTALYMGQNIGKNVGNHPAGSYTGAAWLAELARLDRDPATGRPFRSGDLVEIRARAPGLFFRGKTNINEQHQNDPAADFDVVLLEPNHTRPEPNTITLAEVKDEVDQFRFDASRTTGAERYQGAFVRIEDAQFTAGTWGPNQSMTLTDPTGRTLPVLLGMGAGFTRFGPPTAPFSIVGIFDQEDANAADGFRAGYRLWVMDYDGSDFVLYRYVKPDFDRDGDVDSDDLDRFQACATGPSVPVSDPECRNADFDKDGDVDQDDFGVFQRCLSGPDHLPDPKCDY